jgi:DNA repair protein RadC
VTVIPLRSPASAVRRPARPDGVGARRRLERDGAWSLADADLLELVGGTPSARALLDEDCLAGLRRAEPLELATRGGLGAAAAARLAAAFELGRRAATADVAGWQVRTPADVAERLLPSLAPLEHEELRVLLLTTKNRVTAQRTLYVGNLAGSAVRCGEVFRDAVRRQAAAIVVVHNHPSGDPAPSGDDIRITAELAAAGRLLDIELLDHLVIGAGRWVSLRALGALGVPGEASAARGRGPPQSVATMRYTIPPRASAT